MATATGAYAVLANVKSRLGITDTTDDTVLTEICNETNQMVEEFTGRVLAPLTYTNALFDGYNAFEDGRCLLIPFGILTVTTLETASYTGGPFQTVPATDYFIRPTAQERLPSEPGYELWMTDIPSASNQIPYFLSGFANVRLNGTGGWAATPDDVTMVAENYAVALYRARGAGGSDEFTLGADGVRRFSRLMSSDDVRILEKYRNWTPVIL